MNILIQTIGALVIVAAFIDIYLTVLQRGSISLVSNRMNHIVWWCFRTLAAHLPRFRNRILSFAGPTLIPTTVAMWVILLSVGFALMFMPVMGTRIVASSGPTPTGFLPALYFSAMSLATLGAGDFIATTNFYRLLDTFGALAGIIVLTATLSYLMSVYSSLIRQHSLALALHHATGSPATPEGLVSRLGAGGDFATSQTTLGSLATELISVIEAHHTYTVLRFFIPMEAKYSLPRIAYLTLDATSLMRAALDPEQYHSQLHSASFSQFRGASRQLIDDLGTDLLPEDLVNPATTHEDEQEWRQRFDEALAMLEEEGIALNSSRQDAADRYIEMRREWQPTLSAFMTYLNISPDEVGHGGS